MMLKGQEGGRLLVLAADRQQNTPIMQLLEKLL